MNDPNLAVLTEQERAVFRRRAAALARPVVSAAHLEQGELLITRLGQARYAVRLGELAAVAPLKRIARIPRAPAWVAGLSHEHGRILTVVDLGALAGERSSAALRFGLLVEVGGEPFALGVPELEGLARDWPANDQLPDGIPERARLFIDGISPAGICRLSIPRLLAELARLSSQGNTP